MMQSRLCFIEIQDARNFDDVIIWLCHFSEVQTTDFAMSRAYQLKLL